MTREGWEKLKRGGGREGERRAQAHYFICCSVKRWAGGPQGGNPNKPFSVSCWDFHAATKAFSWSVTKAPLTRSAAEKGKLACFPGRL